MERNVKNKKFKTKYLTKIFFCFILLLIVFLLPKYSNNSLATNQEGSKEFIYLSDIKYTSARVGWGAIHLNETDGGANFSLIIEGANYSFEKGIWAHASSEIVYDLSNYQDYRYFTTYIGVNTSSGNRGNGVKFYVYTSDDGKQWNLKTESDPSAMKSANNAVFLKIDIKNAKFLKLIANDNGANGNDHAVYVEPKLIKETYKEEGEELVPSITELDNKIKTEYANANIETNKEYELTVLKRELINRTGNYALRKFLNASEENKAVFRWLTEDVDNLRLYVLGGTPDGGNYYNSLTQLSRLYNEYSDDFKNNELLNNKWYPKMTYGDLYKKMAITLSLTHSQTVGLWMQSGNEVNRSDALRRYAIFKYLHKNGKLKAGDSLDFTPWFEALQVEEMRYIMNNAIDDEEIIWLNAYVTTKIIEEPGRAWITPHPHMAYVWPNYQNPVYYDENNRDYFNELFAVKDETISENKVGLFDLKYTIPGGKNISTYDITITRGTSDNKIYKLWMNFRNKFGTGAVCGGISKSGSNIRTTHGIPATVIGQPGHAALLCYSKDANGKGYWGIDNDVSGWTLSEKGERLLLGWGNANTNYARGSYQVVYMALAQEAINDYENLIKAEEQVMLANSYKDNFTKQEEIYRKALKIQPINLDAWLGLINVYLTNENKTEDECYALVEEISENLKYFPLPMYQLTNLIQSKLTSVQNSYKFVLLQTRMLTEASKTPNNTADTYYVYQPSLTRTEANFLLGKIDKTIATFSFDGENAGSIVLSSRFDGNGIRWDYSLDGKKNWKEVSFTGEEEHKLLLSNEEIKSITSENDIYIHIVGVNYDEENLYKIDITEQTLPNNLYANYLENRVVAVTETMEWRYTEKDKWTSYKIASPDLTGNKTVQVRVAANGTKLASPESEIYTFTEDNQPNTRKYIPVAHLSIEAYSTQSVDGKRPYYAPNAIDANIKTMWHTDFRYNVIQQGQKPFIIIKLDEPKYISALEFIQVKYKPNDPDFIKNGIVYVSEDGEKWKEAGRIENCPQDNELRDITFNESIYGQYVKLEVETYNMFASVAMINLFEDKTKLEDVKPTAGIYYSTQEKTSNPVIARLVNTSTEITITNNNGKDTYIFNENGEFTFEFKDKNGNKGTAIAKVDWIDKDSPSADVKYILNADKKLTILLDNISEDVYLLDKNNNKINYIEVENKKVTQISYLDNKGDSYKILEKDEKGNTTKITYKNTTGNVTKVSTYITTLENGIVKNEKYLDADGNAIEITDKEKESLRALQQTTRSNPLEYALETSGEYEFKLVDKADNLLYKNIKVDYIENDTKILASDITYDITKTTNKNVIATINPYVINSNGEKTASKIINNNGKNTYTFTNNGKFTFEYKDVNDDRNLEVKQHLAQVNWIDKIAPTAKIQYTKKENEVVAALVNESKEITVTNNNGKKEYTFTKNGEFTFEFTDKLGNKGSATAKVDWLGIPTAEVKYSTKELTNKSVVVTIVNESEEITITNNNGKKEYTFDKNGEFTFEFVNKAGNKGSVTAKVDWIDKVAPTAKIKYDIEKITNKNVVATIVNESEEITVTNNNSKKEYTFTKNGEFIFEFTDKAGNKGTVTAKVNWIDKTAPKASVKYNISELTNKSVVATLVNESEEITITNNNGKKEYTFTKNGEFTFEFTDKAGNKGTAIAKVNWIDKTAPTAEIKYSTQKITNKPVVATLVNESEEITITNNNGKKDYTFTKNGEFTFEFTDKAGNKGTAIAKVDWIDTIVPKAEVRYSKTELTSKPVVVTLVNESEEITITNNNGKKEYTFAENGEFTFEFTDKAGNKGSTTAKVDWIDKTIPIVEIIYNITEPTNKNVVATLVNSNTEITVTNNNGKKEYTFTENGEFTFEYKDKLGNNKKMTAKVNWIDKTAPKAEVKYSITELTNKPVVATLVNESEEITITNNNGKKEYTFDKNGEFTFEFVDKVGNKGSVTAKVDWIDTIAPTAKIKYSTKEATDKVVVTIVNESEEIRITNNNGKKEYTFIKNGEFTFEFVDKAGNKGSVTAKVDWIKKQQEEPEKPEEPVKPENPVESQVGDVNKDGKLSAIDLLLVKRHLVAGKIQEWILKEDKFNAGDINKDGKITATDLILIKRLILEKIEKQ